MPKAKEPKKDKEKQVVTHEDVGNLDDILGKEKSVPEEVEPEVSETAEPVVPEEPKQKQPEEHKLKPQTPGKAFTPAEVMRAHYEALNSIRSMALEHASNPVVQRHLMKMRGTLDELKKDIQRFEENS